MKLDLPNAPISASVAIASLAAFLEQLNPTEADFLDVTNALSEAITNCQLHAYEEMTGNIIVIYTLNDRNLTVTVRDCGTGIADIETAMVPLFTTIKGRNGMGFTFIETLMDDVNITSITGRGTTVTMKKKFANR